jgi:amino acid transporter
MAKPQQLKRSVGMALLVFYGLGTILGAGIYVLVGEVVQAAGVLAPLSFLLAGSVAALTAFSYAELSARFPVSAGEAYYLQQAFGQTWLSAGAGYLVVLIAIISSATICNGFAAYFNLWFELPAWLSVSLLVLLLGLIASWGIKESVGIASFITVVEIAGLLLIIWLGKGGIQDFPAVLDQWQDTPTIDAGHAIIAGAFLAFFAFIGFEDMVNIAEEVIEPTQTVPRAIIIALVLAMVLYLLVALSAVASLPLAAIAGSQAALAAIVKLQQPALLPLITAISLVAVVNGALIQIIKGSRVIYGMARNGMAPALLGRINYRTRTPLLATALCTALIAAFALGFELLALARLTSFVTLIVFTLVNTALIVLKRRNHASDGLFSVPLMVPVAGMLSSLAFIVYEVVILIYNRA